MEKDRVSPGQVSIVISPERPGPDWPEKNTLLAEKNTWLAKKKPGWPKNTWLAGKYNWLADKNTWLADENTWLAGLIPGWPKKYLVGQVSRGNDSSGGGGVANETPIFGSICHLS